MPYLLYETARIFQGPDQGAGIVHAARVIDSSIK
jgi:hypothetical protein